jgi:hypothetical protein
MKLIQNQGSSSVALLSLIIVMSILIFLLFWKVIESNKTVSNLNQVFESLESMSEAHEFLLPIYYQCRRRPFADSRAECILLVKSMAEIEGIEKNDFERVYSDIKTTVWVKTSY